MNDLWRSAFNKPWQYGDYHRAVVQLNKQVVSRLNTSVVEQLKPGYSQKAVFLKGVDSGDALYLPAAGSQTQSLALLSQPVDPQQSPVVWSNFGDGKIGYVGDVNAEEGSTLTILTMCGL